MRLLEKDLKLRKGDSYMLWWKGYVSKLGQCTRTAAAVVVVDAAEHDEQRPEHGDDDGDNAEVVAVVAAVGRTFAENAGADAAAVGSERPIAAQTSRKSREGRDRR